MCFVHLGSKTGPDTPVLAPAPRPMGFQTALASIFGDERVNTVDAQALAELAAIASSYQPSPAGIDPVQVPDSQPAEDTVMSTTGEPLSSQELIPYVPESSAPELPMDLGNGQNTEKSGLGDSQHAHTETQSSNLTPFSDPSLPYPTSQDPLPSPTRFASSWSDTASQQSKGKTTRSVRFSSPLARIWSPKEIPDTFSEASGSIQTNPEKEQVTIDLCQLLDKEGATPENTGLSENFLNGAATRKDLINYMVILEESMEKKMIEMEERIVTSINKARNPNPPGPSGTRPPPRPQQTRPPPTPKPPALKPTLVPVRNPTTTLAPEKEREEAKEKKKEAWSAIAAAGINTDGFKLVQTRRRNASPEPGVGRKNAPSAPSTPHARQRRLLVKSVEKNRRVGTSDCTPAKIRDAINSASGTTRLAYAEYNRNDDLVLTTVGDLPAELALTNIKGITKALNDIGIFGFNIGLDTPTVNIVINSIPLATSGDKHWAPEEWNIEAPAWTELENELTAFNPELRLMDRPKWIKSVWALEAENKEKSSIIVAVEANDWLLTELKKPHPAMAVYGLRCSFRKYIRKDASTHCERCLQYGHHGAHCRMPSICKYCGNQHHTKDHMCMSLYCTAGKGKPCSHTIRRCVNCDETSHFTGDRHCPTRTRARSPTTAEKGKAPAEPANPNPHK